MVPQEEDARGTLEEQNLLQFEAPGALKTFWILWVLGFMRGLERRKAMDVCFGDPAVCGRPH